MFLINLKKIKRNCKPDFWINKKFFRCFGFCIFSPISFFKKLSLMFSLFQVSGHFLNEFHVVEKLFGNHS